MRKTLTIVVAAGLATAAVAASPAGASFKQSAAHVAKKCKKGKKSAAAAKKCKKKVAAPVTVPAPPAQPTPLALTDAEVIARVTQQALNYCFVDPNCVNYGYYSTDQAGTLAACASRSTYTWSCYGWNDEDIDADPQVDATCDFREIVTRTGINGITSRQDLTYGGNGGAGWNCHLPT